MCYTLPLPSTSYTFFIVMLNFSHAFTSWDVSTSLTTWSYLIVPRSASQPKHCYECSVMVLAIIFIFIGHVFNLITLNRWLQTDSRHWGKFQYCNWHECLGWGKWMLVLFPIFSYKFLSHNALLTFCMGFESSPYHYILYSPLSPALYVLKSLGNYWRTDWKKEGEKRNPHPLLITCNRYRTTNAGQCGQRRKDTFFCLYPMFLFYFVNPLTGWYNAAVEDGSIPRERFIWITKLSKLFSLNGDLLCIQN